MAAFEAKLERERMIEKQNREKLAKEAAKEVADKVAEDARIRKLNMMNKPTDKRSLCSPTSDGNKSVFVINKQGSMSQVCF